MSLTITKIGSLVPVGDSYQQAALLTLGLYATGGVGPLSADDFGLSTLDWLQITSPGQPSPWVGAVMYEYVRDSKKIKVWVTSASPTVELPNGSSLVNTVIQVLVQGK